MGKPSLFDSIGSGFKKGVDSVTSFFTPKPQEQPAQDPISLSTEAKGGPELHVAMARLYEQNGRMPEAVKAYQQALKMAPKDPKVLAAYAGFKARSGDLDEAIKLYQRAAKLVPEDPGVANDLGLCLARRQRHAEAVALLRRAVQLQPANPLYRNNLATVLVQMGEPDEALKHLRAAQSEAVAQYNVGYLLNKQGQSVAAAQHFAFALQRDPSLEAARYWLDRISAQPAGASASMPWPAVPSGSWSGQSASGPMAGVVPPAATQNGPPLAGPPLAGPPAAALPLAMPLDPAPLPPPLPNVDNSAIAPSPPPDSFYPDPRPGTPAVGRRGNYDSQIRRQGLVEITDDPAPPKTKRLPPGRLPNPE